ncbi:RHS repeat-associated core domain-containing protein [Sorangium sp. So ce834]|uniref:RHS repeat-associated core domain-containing protein n=1 Tax=Sorangium sp. So ce834 TaxID=3133321 RepID=UPI003F5F39DD
MTLYVGDLYERVTRLAPEAGEPSVEHRYSVLVKGRPVALVTRVAGAPGTTLYLHRDNLGSIDVITDASGGVHERRSYQAWGKRRQPTWESAAPGSFGSSPVRRGFTGHEGDDELGLVNMRGRMYDPEIGRFLTPDPLVANPLSGQSLNPYSYVLNNPLAYVDPNGFQEAPAEDLDASRPPAVMYIPWEKLGWAPEEIAVGKRPERKARSDTDANTTGAEVGVIAPPIDVNIYGTSSGYVPEPVASTPDQSTVGSVVGEGLLGVGEGLGELTVELGRSLVLSALTFGGYGAYEFGTAMWDGYKEDGVVGALNAVNPLYHALRAGTDTVLAAVGGDYRAAGAAGTKAVVLTLGAAVGLGEGLTAVSGRALATRAATGEGWLVSRGVFRNRHGQLTNGRYILDEPATARHTVGSLAHGKSQFFYRVNAKQHHP